MTKCCTKVRGSGQWGWLHPHQCTRKGIIEREGQLYCKTHDPVAVLQRDKKSQEEFDKNQAQRRKEWEILKNFEEFHEALEEALCLIADACIMHHDNKEWDNVRKQVKLAHKKSLAIKRGEVI